MEQETLAKLCIFSKKGWYFKGWG